MGIIQRITDTFKKKEQMGSPVFHESEKASAESFQQRTGITPTVVKSGGGSGRTGQTSMAYQKYVVDDCASDGTIWNVKLVTCTLE